MEKRDLWIDYSKAIAVLALSYINIQRALFNDGFRDFSANFHIVDSVINAAIIPLCLCIAGIMYSKKMDKEDNTRLPFFTYLIDTLLYAFVLWSTFQYIIDFMFSGYTGSANVLMDLLSDLTSEPQSHFWLLIALFVSHSLTLLLNPRSNTLLLIGFGVFSFAHIYHAQLPQIYPLHYLPKFYCFYLLGLLVYRHIDIIEKKAGLLLVLSSGSFFLANALLHIGFKTDSYEITYLTYIIALSGVATVITLSLCFKEFSVYAASLVGRSAFSIFLMHMIFGSGIREVLQNTFQIDHAIIHLIVGIVFAIIASIIAHQIITRWNLTIFFRAPHWLSAKRWLTLVFERLAIQPRLRYTLFALGTSFAALVVTIQYISHQQLQFKGSSLPGKPLQLSTAADDIVEGKRLAQVLGCYRGCHGNDMQGIMFSRAPFIGTFSSANLTQIIDKYSTQQLDGIIRHGVKPNGGLINGHMPSAAFHNLSDDKLAKVLSFIKSYPKASSSLPAPSLGFKTQLEIVMGERATEFEKIQTAKAALGKRYTRQINSGEELALTVCGECHGPNLTGKTEGNTPSLIVASAYSFEQFNTLLLKGEKISGDKARLMSIVNGSRFAHLTEQEIIEIYNFLTREFPQKYL